MYTKANEFLENISGMKKDELKEVLKLSTLITEEKIENGVSSKKESYIIDRKKEDELAYISDIEENILENTDKENNIEYKADFYKLNEKEINKIADEIKNDNLSGEDFENLYSKKIRTIDFEEREKSRNFIEVLDFISENLKKQGGFIPGVRPGESTASYLNEVAGRLTLGGALYLGIISTLPWVLVKTMGVPFYFGGTSVLIVVSVALDTMRRIEAQSYTNKYQTLSAVGL